MAAQQHREQGRARMARGENIGQSYHLNSGTKDSEEVFNQLTYAVAGGASVCEDAASSGPAKDSPKKGSPLVKARRRSAATRNPTPIAAHIPTELATG